MKYFLHSFQLSVDRTACNLSYFTCSCKHLLWKVLKTGLVFKCFACVGVAGYWVNPVMQEPLVTPSAALDPNQTCDDIAQADVAVCSLTRVKDYSTSCETGVADAFSPVLKHIQGSLHHHRTEGQILAQ